MEEIKANVFSKNILVYQSDIDELGHVNNVVYLGWAQEVAAAHWNVLATPEIKKLNVWVVLRHEIDYLGAAFENDQLVANTWVGETTGPRSIRYVEITNPKTGKTLVKAKTTWCMLDSQSMRPKRIDESIIKILKGAVNN
ncbi:MAG: acyl-CoA thioesterase [Flammeovirgaceae bacterium]|nr:acyl-CoA thioesterase [Flammeovirgaceae bacterium]